MKKLILTALVITGLTATAQVKVGSNPTTLATNANFQVEGTTTAEQFVVLKNGNVGIGTTAPKERLLVVDGFNSQVAFTVSDNEQPATLSTMPGYFGTSITHNFSGGSGESTFINRDDNALRSRGFTFVNQTGTGTFTGSLLRILASGKIGLGDGNPVSKLQINATGVSSSIFSYGQTVGNLAGNGIENLRFETSTGTGNTQNMYLYTARAESGSDWTGTHSSFMRRIDVTDVGEIRFGGTAADSYSISFLNYGGIERMRITSLGNVGIGTSAPTAPLQIVKNAIGNNNSIIEWNSDAKWAGFKPNLGNGSYNSISAAGDMGYIFDNDGNPTASNGGFLIAPWSNTTGGIKIMENGNFGVGEPFPSSRLHVAGAVTIVDGTQGAGKVLTSNASGLASWAYSSNTYKYPNASQSGSLGTSTTATNGAGWVAVSNPITIAKGGVYYIDGNTPVNTTGSFYLGLNDAANSFSKLLFIDDEASNIPHSKTIYIPAGTYYIKLISVSGGGSATANGCNFYLDPLFVEP
jgi:hypothetical protein